MMRASERGIQRFTWAPKTIQEATASVVERLEHRTLLSGVPADGSYAPLSQQAGSEEITVVEWNGREMRVVKNEWLVGLDVSSPSPGRAEQIVRRLGVNATFRFALSGGKVALVELPDGVGHEALVTALKNEGVFEFVKPNAVLQRHSVPNDRLFPAQWGLHNSGQNGGVVDADVDAPEAWDVSVGSSTVTVAVIDTGVDYAHRDLYKNVWINKGEIPSAIYARLQDLDGDGIISLWDLNDPVNQGTGKINDSPEDGNDYIDAGDLIRPTTAGGWANGVDDDANNYQDGNAEIDDIVGWDFSGDEAPFIPDNDPMDFDSSGHGTHVAGIIGAAGNDIQGVAGAARKVSILPLRTGDDEAEIAKAIEYVASLPSIMGQNRIISASFGGYFEVDQVSTAIQQARAAGVLFVASAGNDAENTDVSFHYPSTYGDEDQDGLDEHSNIIAVGATQRYGGISGLSNYGRTTVDVTAPGEAILSTVPEDRYEYKTGTSQAAPMVSGIAALMWALRPNATYVQIKQALIDSVDLDASLLNTTVSGGRVNAKRALELIREYATTAPNNTVQGTAGNDRIAVRNNGQNVEVAVGPTGSEVVQLTRPKTAPGWIVIQGLGGNDTITVGDDVTAGVEIHGGDGDDAIDGGGGEDRLYGGLGTDNILGAADNDTLVGGPGHDVLRGGDGDDFILGDNTPQTDAASPMPLNAQDDDDLYGDAGSDVFAFRYNGANGDAVFEGSSADSDRVDFSAMVLVGHPEQDVGFTLNLGTAGSRASGPAAMTMPNNGLRLYFNSATGVESAFGTPLIDTIVGNARNNFLAGASGNDLLQGLGGDDTLFGGRYNDTMEGGAGGDTYLYMTFALDQVHQHPIYQGADQAIELSAAQAPADVDSLDLRDVDAPASVNLGHHPGGGQYIAFALGNITGTSQMQLVASDATAFENVWGTHYNDTIYGNARNNTLWGGGGDDTMGGQEGDDELVVDFDDHGYDFGVSLDGGTHSAGGRDVVRLLNIPDRADLTLSETGGSVGGVPVAITAVEHVRLATLGALDDLWLGGTLDAQLEGRSGVLRTRTLTMATTARLDIVDNDMIIEQAATRLQQGVPISESAAAAVRGLVASARNSQAVRWAGPGITSSAAAAEPLTTLATMLNPGLSTFAGQAVDANDVLIKYTYNGDANLDGVINADDYFQIDSGFLEQPANPTYAEGDFNYDDKINADDYFLIDSAFLEQTGDIDEMFAGGGGGGGSLMAGAGGGEGALVDGGGGGGDSLLSESSQANLTIDLRLAGTGGKTAQVTSVGQVITIDVYATVTGDLATARQAFQSVQGSFTSTNVSLGAAKGTLAVVNTSEFDAGGASYGVQRDLDSDGDLDIGGTDPTDADGYWTARAGAVRRSPTLTQSYTWKVATLTFTVTQLIAGTGTTEVNFVKRSGAEEGALWMPDNLAQNLQDGTSSAFTVGTPVVLTR